MSIRNFDRIFAPRSVALIGASDRPGSVGALTLANLRSGGFRGELLLVNPKHDTLGGMRVYPDVASLPSVPDLAVVAIPPERVAGVVGELGSRGTRAVVVLTAGFGELGERGAELQRAMLAAAEPFVLRVVGPNCIGVIVPGIGLNASFAPVEPPPGDIAFVSQSGALVTVVLDWAQPRGIGFSHIVSLGDMADVDFGDLLEFLAADAATRAIVLYVEGITHAPKFMRAARAAARAKPVLVLKVGRHAESAKAARSHTGALAGSDAVYDAAFRRAGMLRVDTMPQLFDALETLALTPPARGDRLAIVTNGGGPGVMATDAAVGAGARLAELSTATTARLDAFLPKTWSRANPVDMIGDSPPRDYAAAVDVLLGDDGVDGILVLHAPTALADPREPARAVIETLQAHAGDAVRPNVFTAWLGDRLVAPARELFAAARVPTYETPEDAVQGFMDRVRFQRGQELLAASPDTASGAPADAAAARAVVERAAAAGRTLLEPDEVASVLAAYGIPALRGRTVADVEAAVRAAEEIGGPVALKIRSPQIVHKSDAGGVALDLEGAERVRAAAQAMLARVAQAQPAARIEGFFVEAMSRRPGAIELIVGLSVDRVFGPVILFGRGGTAVELIGDTSLELAPLDRALARAQMARTRVWRLLQGYRGTPAVDVDAVADLLVRVGTLAAEQPAIRELDINPLLADARGVVAVDARIVVGAAPRASESGRAGESRID